MFKIRDTVGSFFSFCVALAFALFIYGVYPKTEYLPPVAEKGYSAEYRARLDDLIANITPLSVADLGE